MLGTTFGCRLNFSLQKSRPTQVAEIDNASRMTWTTHGVTAAKVGKTRTLLTTNTTAAFLVYADMTTAVCALSSTTLILACSPTFALPLVPSVRVRVREEGVRARVRVRVRMRVRVRVRVRARGS
jgi:hypothetical protein